VKRSEVLKLIKGLFEVGTDFDLEARADNLLCNLEQLGMRPPLYSIKIDDSLLGTIEVLESKWEEE